MSVKVVLQPFMHSSEITFSQIYSPPQHTTRTYFDAMLFTHISRVSYHSFHFFQELVSHHGKFVVHSEEREIHRETVKRIRYMADNESIMSCSLDPKRSLVVMDAVRGKNKSYIFSLSKVCRICWCFQSNSRLDLGSV